MIGGGGDVHRPGGFIGIVGSHDPCANAVFSHEAASPTAFIDSPYGIARGFHADPTPFVPYRIDPVTLQIEWREDLAVSGYARWNLYAMSDTMMLATDNDDPFAHGAPFTLSLVALTRSGIALTASGGQQAVTSPSPSQWICRIDATHFTRSYNPNNFSMQVDVMSVSGGTISLVTTSNLITGYNVTRDPAPYESTAQPVTISPIMYPFHYNAGTLYCFGNGSGFAGTDRIHAVPFTIGGGIAVPLGLSTRSQDAQNISRVIGLPTKVGSSEFIGHVGGGIGGFYDGPPMHMNQGAYPTGYLQANVFDVDNVHGSYLGYVTQNPLGTPVTPFPALISQSGNSLSVSPITPVFCCPAISGTNINGYITTRHQANLGATTNNYAGADLWNLSAFKW